MPIRPAHLLLLGLLCLFPATTQAGVHPKATILLHLVPVDQFPRRACEATLPSTAQDVVTAGEINQQYLAYVIVAGTDTTQGVSGVQFGIHYEGGEDEGILIEHWQRCSLYEWHLDDWPLPSTGNLLTWAQNQDCQRTEPVVVGFFCLTARSPDRLSIIPRPADSLASLAACEINPINLNDRVDNLAIGQLGWVDFGGKPGYNPWDPKQNMSTVNQQFKPIKN